MQVRALRTLVGDYGRLERNTEADIPDHRARQLIHKGYAVAVGDIVVPQTTPVESEGHESDPFEERRAGGQTGEEKHASSSHRGRPRKKSKSTEREDDAAA